MYNIKHFGHMPPDPILKPEGYPFSMVELESCGVFGSPSKEPKDQFRRVLLTIRRLNKSSIQKRPEVVSRKEVEFHRDDASLYA